MRIAIASGKGGTGKTLLASNLADYLSQKQKVVLLDLDVEEPNASLFFRAETLSSQIIQKMVPQWLKEPCDGCGICQEVCNYNAIVQLGPEILVFPQLCHGCYACSELCPQQALPMTASRAGELNIAKINNLTLVEARMDIGEEQAVPVIRDGYRYVNSHFDQNQTIVIDCPPGTSCPVIEAVSQADFVILITDPTPFGFHDLKLAIATMRQLEKKFAVVINRVGLGNNSIEKYCLDENIEIIAEIQDDRDLAAAYSAGMILYPDFPNISAALLQIEEHMNRIMQPAQ